MRPGNVTEEESPLIYGLELQARALSSGSSSANDANLVRFLVGTQSLKSDNQLHVLEYLEEQHTLSKVIFKHSAGEIWNLAASPQDPQHVLTCYSLQSPTFEGQVENRCTLWKFPVDLSCNIIDEDSISPLPLERVADFDFDSAMGRIDVGRNALWRPEEGNQIVNYSGNKVYLWDVESQQLITSFAVEDRSRGSSKLSKITSIRWSPHSNCSTLGVAIGNSLNGMDLRSKNGGGDSNSFTGGGNNAWTISAHSHLVRDLDFNPNAQYYIASCGDDCESRFWDIRNPTVRQR